MKAGSAIVKKCFVMLLTTFYLFIAVTYLLYLPKFSPLRINGNYVQAKSQLVVKSSHKIKNTGANVLVLIHRAYKSTVENKREIISKLLQIGVVFVFVITSGALLQRLMSFMTGVINTRRPQQYAYLSNCILRI